jgi:hypothetical protein
VLLLTAQIAPAQVAGGTVTGSIQDLSGLMIANANVSMRNRATSVVTTAITDKAGFYAAPNLLPGDYEITATAAGFAPKRTVITLTVGEQQVVNLSLSIGSVDQTVMVVDTPPAIELSSSALTSAVDGATIRNLPLNGRSYTDLATLEPGVAAVQAQVGFDQGAGRGNRGFGPQLSIDGGRPQQNNYRLDGISINDYSNGGPGSVVGINLGVDAIGEFSVVTSNYSAEYGKTSGGVINTSTRAGTNQIHGNVFEFIRNSYLDTKNYFDVFGKPQFKQNQFGGSVGAPIIRNRVFIFGAYESVRRARGVTATITVPSLNARQGILTNGTVTVDPTSKKYLALYPLPNGLVNGNTAGYAFVNKQFVTENFFTVRNDYKLTQKDSAFVTYLFDTAPFTQGDAQNNVQQGSKTGRQALVIEENHVFTPSLVNSVRFGLNRQAIENNASRQALNPVAADTSLGLAVGRTAGGLNIPGLDRMVGGTGSSPTYFFHFTTFQGYDDAFYTKGTHSMKFGASYERLQNNILALSNPNGLFNFASLQTFLTDTPKKFTIGLAATLNPRNLRQNLTGFYFQDDWHLRSNLTFNLGLRYEFSSVPTEVAGKLSTLRKLTDATPHLGNPYFNNPTLRDFEPRVGFAYDPFRNGKSSIRAGFGIYDSQPLLYEFEVLSALTAPFFQIGTTTGAAINLASTPAAVSAAVTSSPTTLSQAYVDPNPKRNYILQYNVSLQRDLGKSNTITLGYAGSRAKHNPFRVEDANIVLPTLTPAGYLWPSPAGSGARLNPNVGTIRAVFNISGADYDSLMLSTTAKPVHDLTIRGSFTWEKSLDDSSATIAGDAFGNSVPSLDFFAPHINRGRSDFDVSKVLAVSGLYDLPKFRGDGVGARLANGFELGGIYKANTGVAFTPLIGGDPLGKNSSDPWDYPNRTPGCDVINHNFKANGSARTNSYVNLACFTAPNPLTLRGNAGRNIITGPTLSDLDMTLVKNTALGFLGEQGNLQFRIETFNILNHTNFAIPSNNNQQLFDATGTLLTGSAGVLSAPTATGSRQMQFALKIVF